MFQNIFYKPIFGQIHKKKHIILLLQFLTAFSRRALPLPLSAKNPCRETHPPAPAFNNPPAPPPSPERDPHGGGEGSRIKEKVGKGPGRREGGKETEREETEERNEKDRTGRKAGGSVPEAGESHWTPLYRPGEPAGPEYPRPPLPNTAALGEGGGSHKKNPPPQACPLSGEGPCGGGFLKTAATYSPT